MAASKSWYSIQYGNGRFLAGQRQEFLGVGYSLQVVRLWATWNYYEIRNTSSSHGGLFRPSRGINNNQIDPTLFSLLER